MIGQEARAPARVDAAERNPAHKLLVIRVLNFLTNEIVCHVPSFALRRLWYRHALGISFGRHAGIHLACRINFFGPGQLRRNGLRIGDQTRVNRACLLDARGGLEIGANVSISPEVVILTASHGVNDPGFCLETRPVRIEDHVWIGTRAMVMPGVTLGRGCVVAAGAVVTRDVAPLAIVAGVPARAIAERAAETLGYVLDSPFPLFE